MNDTQLPKAVREAMKAGAPEPVAIPLQRSPSGRVNVWGIVGPYNDGLPMAGPDGSTWRFPSRVAAESAIRDGKHVARIYKGWLAAEHPAPDVDRGKPEQAEPVTDLMHALRLSLQDAVERPEPDHAFADDRPTDDDLAADQAAGASDDAEGLPDLSDLAGADQRDAERPQRPQRERKQRPATNDPATDAWRAMRDVVHALWRADGHLAKRPLIVLVELQNDQGDASLELIGERARWRYLAEYWNAQQLTCREAAVTAVLDAKAAGVGWRALDAITRHPEVRGLHAAVQRAYRLRGALVGIDSAT
jgi:hypothetical protein